MLAQGENCLNKIVYWNFSQQRKGKLLFLFNYEIDLNH